MRTFAALAAVATLAVCGRAIADPVQMQALPASEYAFQGLNLADMGETLYVLHHGGSELNPILGRHPSDGAVVGLKLGVGVLHAGVTEYLETHGVARKWIDLWEDVSIVEGAGVSVWNGVQISKRF